MSIEFNTNMVGIYEGDIILDESLSGDVFNTSHFEIYKRYVKRNIKNTNTEVRDIIDGFADLSRIIVYRAINLTNTYVATITGSNGYTFHINFITPMDITIIDRIYLINQIINNVTSIYSDCVGEYILQCLNNLIKKLELYIDDSGYIPYKNRLKEVLSILVILQNSNVFKAHYDSKIYILNLDTICSVCGIDGDLDYNSDKTLYNVLCGCFYVNKNLTSDDVIYLGLVDYNSK